MKKKLLHITQSTIGGTLEYLKLLLPRLDKNKYDITLLCPSYGPMMSDIKSLGIDVYELDMSREINIKNDFISIIKLRQFLKRNNYDLIHLHSSKAGAIGRLANVFSGIPVVYNSHGWAFNMRVSEEKKQFYVMVERLLSVLSDYIICISKSEYDVAIRKRIAKREKLLLINNAIDVEKFITFSGDINTFKKQIGIEKDEIIIGMVARLTEQKDPLTFIKIAQHMIKDKKHKYKFILVGDGELREEVERQINYFGIKNNVIITGWTNDVHKYIKIFDVALLTSRWEGFGLVLAEYLAAKVPVVASKVDGIPNVIIDGETGLLVEPCNVTGFVLAIEQILNDKSLRNMFVINGLDRVKKYFTIDRLVKEHEELYDKLIDRQM